jgi:hypothetical protein
VTWAGAAGLMGSWAAAMLLAVLPLAPGSAAPLDWRLRSSPGTRATPSASCSPAGRRPSGSSGSTPRRSPRTTAPGTRPAGWGSPCGSCWSWDGAAGTSPRAWLPGGQGSAGARRPDEGPLRGAIGLPVGSGLLGLPLAFWAISAQGGPSPPAVRHRRTRFLHRPAVPRSWLSARWLPCGLRCGFGLPRASDPLGHSDRFRINPPSHLLPAAPVHASKIHDLSDTPTLHPAGYRALQSRGPRSRVARAEHPGGGLAKGRAGHPRSPPSPLLSADHLLANGPFQGTPPPGGRVA